mmetsp:Transcript_80013/g.161912  ORF Transcript_80013/g.161912 Transcript_80013/m.161912 type:complete len:92 (-) Transcript_80013:39-314(-)
MIVFFVSVGLQPVIIPHTLVCKDIVVSFMDERGDKVSSDPLAKDSTSSICWSPFLPFSNIDNSSVFSRCIVIPGVLFFVQKEGQLQSYLSA